MKTPFEYNQLVNNSNKDIGPQDMLSALRNKNCYKSKIIISGNELIVMDYDKPNYRGYSSNRTSNNTNDKDNWYQDITKEEKKEYSKQNNNRKTAKQLNNLYNSNTDTLNYFYTLTLGTQDFKKLAQNYADDFTQEELNSLNNITDIRKNSCPLNEDLRTKVRNKLGDKLQAFKRVKNNTNYKYKSQINPAVSRLLNCYIRESKEITFDEVNRVWQNFLQKMHRNLNKALKYIVVFEKSKNGRVHIHLASNIQLSNYDLQHKWQNGTVKQRRIDNDKKAIEYLTKSYTTNSENEDSAFFNGRQKYRCSEKLRRPQEVTDKQEVQIVKEKLLKGVEPSEKKRIESKREAGNSFTKTVYKINDLSILTSIRRLRYKYFKKIIKFMIKKNLTTITDNQYFNIRQSYHRELNNKCWQLNKILSSNLKNNKIS